MRLLSVDWAFHKTSIALYDSETKKSYINIGETKTNAGTRIVPMTVKLANILKEIRTEEKIYVASGREIPTEPRTLRQAFDRLLDKLEIKHIKFHGLRHTFSTRAIKAGVDPKTLAKILGHENCNITLDIYTSVTKEMLQKGIEKLA